MVNAVGRELYEKFFRGYTRKQWGLDPSELDKSVTARVPTRTNTRRPLFHRQVPGHAGARLHARCSSACSIIRNIDVLTRHRLSTTSTTSVDRRPASIYTGPIDEYFDFRFGKLPYR